MILETIPDQCEWGVCIVGTGPVGMALALEYDRLGVEVLLLEAGGAENSPSSAEAARAHIVDPARHAPMEIAVCRALGGTSWTWGGRCVPYDDIDWMPRSFVADAHWPIGHEEIRPWYRAAADYLLCGSDVFSVPYPRALSDGLTLDGIERWARNPKLMQEHRRRIIQSTCIKVRLNSVVTGINLSEGGTCVTSLAVSSPEGQRVVRAKQFLLAMGGVETTRLLLHAQQRWPRHFGGVDGPLGRYYMGHISGKIAGIQFHDPTMIHDLDFKLDSCGAYYRRRFMLSAAAQMDHGLLNTAFWPDNPAFYDPSHGNGVLSSVFLALAFPPTGRRLLSEPIRLAHTGPRPYRLAAHLRNAILGAPRGAADIYTILRDRFIKKPRKPGFLVSSKSGKYALHYHGEHAPNPESRIRLANDTDAFGLPRVQIDLRFTAQDVQSVIDSHDVLSKALESSGIARLEYYYPREKVRESVYAQAADGFHQVGTTRMDEDPRKGVVDANLKVHGVDNLYVASSSVFPTSGQANSTLLAVAFAVRLVHHLQQKSG